MAVLIPDMDYPKRCGDCDFCVMFTDNMTDRSYFRCVHLYEDANTEKKRGDCPLVEVPAHGDLVDLKKFVEQDDYGKVFQYDKKNS